MTESSSPEVNARSSSILKKRNVALFFIILALAAAAFWSLRRPAAPVAVSKVTIAVPTQISSAPMIVAFAQNLFQQSGVEVINQPFLLGKDALKSVLDDKADLAIVADVPFMFALMNGNDIAMLACISQARRSLAIVARTDRNIHQVSDLAGKTVALTKGANFPYFLDAMLNVNKVPTDKVTLFDLKVDQVISAFKEGKADAAVLFQPFLAQLESTMGDQMKIFYGEDVYAFRFLLVGKPSYIDSHPQEIQRILAALSAANKSIRNDPVAARKVVSSVVKIDDTVMAKLFNAEDYDLTLDQATLLALDDQTRWAMQAGLIKQGAVPNFLKYIKYQNLEAVQPSSVKIIR